jgi:hypothetical protein
MQTSENHSQKATWPVLIGAVVLLLIFALAVKVLVGLAPAGADADLVRAGERTKAREELEAENKQKLETYAWADKAKGTVQIPITEAMAITLTELQANKPHAAGPIATPAPAAAPVPSAPPAPTP